jgi:hypothetical protein
VFDHGQWFPAGFVPITVAGQKRNFTAFPTSVRRDRGSRKKIPVLRKGNRGILLVTALHILPSENFLCEATPGRFSGLRVILLAAPSRPMSQWLWRRSYPITAAGPRRAFTVFPLVSPEETPVAGMSGHIVCPQGVYVKKNVRRNPETHNIHAVSRALMGTFMETSFNLLAAERV